MAPDTLGDGPLHAHAKPGAAAKAGLVQIGIEGWRRSRNLSLTRKGTVLLAEATPLWQIVQHRLRDQLGAARWAAVHEVLDVLATVT